MDIFDERAQDKNRVDQDLGCLQNVDERLSIWGWETGTGARFAIVVDIWGKEGKNHIPGREMLQIGVKDADLKPVRRFPYNRERWAQYVLTQIFGMIGFQSITDCIHSIATEPFLRTGRSYADGNRK